MLICCQHLSHGRERRAPTQGRQELRLTTDYTDVRRFSLREFKRSALNAINWTEAINHAASSRTERKESVEIREICRWHLRWAPVVVKFSVSHVRAPLCRSPGGVRGTKANRRHTEDGRTLSTGVLSPLFRES